MLGQASGARVQPEPIYHPPCRLALYVYEYLLHVGAQKSAQTFLSEVSQHLSPLPGHPTLPCVVQLVGGSLLRACPSLCLPPIDPLGKEHHIG